jgi:2-succinyl-5-enolpyruvyl-6-hydroxy-3-cyclohexene-1-carboxylate synthase
MPLAVEATGQLRFGHDDANGSTDGVFAYFEPVYRGASGRELLRPDLILQLGGTPASAGLLQLLTETAGDPDVFRVVVAPFGWPDPESSAGRRRTPPLIDSARIGWNPSGVRMRSPLGRSRVS